MLPLLISTGLALGSCGGGSSTPATPNTPTVTNDLAVATSPSPGSTVNVPAGGSGLLTSITFTFTVTFRERTQNAQVYFQLSDASGRVCASGMTDPFELPAGQPTTVRDNSIVLLCSEGTFTTTGMRATLFGPNPGNLNADQRTGLLAKNFSGGFTFVRPSAPAPAPTPGPNPNPTPKPPTPTPPPNGVAVCPGSPPTGQCINSQPGKATGRCKDGAYTCSTTTSGGTCGSGHGGLQCVYCPGALCN